MRVGLSATEFDPEGAIVLHVQDEDDIRTIERRANKVPVLDGDGVVVNDRGVFAGDQTWKLRWRDRDQREAVKRMVALYPQIRVTTTEGVFSAIPLRYTESGAESELTLSVVARLDG